MGNAGTQITVIVKRSGTELNFTVSPVKTEEGLVRIGVWIRDNMLGIGTLTFYDPESGVYGALGHGINEKTPASFYRSRAATCCVQKLKA